MAFRRRFPLLLLLITLLATALQFWALEAQSLWYDEGFSVWLAKQSLPAIIEITAADIQPPLYYLLLNGWIHLTGQSEYTLRFLSALFAVLCVPLMGQLARRLTHNTVAGTIAALVVAISPLWLWYGREVRNYALLLAILLASAYFLLRFFERGRNNIRTVSIIAVLLTIGLYTHYFMLFVVAAWGVVAGLFALKDLKSHLRPVLLAFGLPLVLYAPWLGIMVTRLGEDRSYWEGELNVGEALSKTFASWVAGHTILEAEAIRWGLIGVGLAVVGIGVLFRQNAGTTTPPMPEKQGNDDMVVSRFASFLITSWLIVPVVSYLAVALNRPKFNARYLIFSAPAFWLAIVVVVVWAWRKNKVLGGVLATIIVLAQLQATANLYSDPAFAKANWRGVAAYVQDHQIPNEKIVLVSGHAYPMTDYYLPGVAVLPLPPERTLDTTAIVGVKDASLLAAGLAGSEGVWLINWQDEVVDPEGVVPAWMTMQGGEAQEVPLFQEVRLSHWTFATNATLAPEYAPQHPLEVRFEEALTLKGWSVLPTLNPSDEGLAVQLFWTAQRPLEGDYNMRLRVVDEAGFEYGVLGDQRPTAYNLPTFRWQPNDLRLANLAVPLLAGTPPGDYWIELSIYETLAEGNLDILDGANAPQGQTARVGPITLHATPYHGAGSFRPRTTQTINQPLLGDWHVTDFSSFSDPVFTTIRAGRRLPLYLWLVADASHPITAVGFFWRAGERVVEVEPQPLVNYGWRSGDKFVVPFGVRTPTEAGTWDLAVQAFDEAGDTVLVALDTYKIEGSDYNFVAPTPTVVQPATFGDSIQLLGYDVNDGDNTLHLTFHWEVLAPLDSSYTAFVHVLDANGVIVPDAGQDKLPLDGARPTDGWVEGEYLSDTFTVSLPAEGYATPYQIEIGWYDAQASTFPRLFATGVGADGNRVILEGISFP